MKKTTLLFVAIIICAGPLIAHNALALNEKTHSEINGAAAQINSNGFLLNSFLIDNINITEGTDAVFYKRGLFGIKTNASVLQWIKDGGKYEDTRPVSLGGIFGGIPYARSFFHFHDPNKPMSDAGFHGILYWDSAIVWGLSPNKQSGLNLGDYSWPAARNFFYEALTATEVDTRNDNFSDCFRSIGQLMHLVEDQSVPEHTRDQGHIAYNLETWVLDNQNGVIFNNSMANPVIPYSTVLSQSGTLDSGIGGLPISRLFDTGNYGGTNPAVTTGQDIGLSEYSNANFFSKHTVMDYNYPKNAVFKNTSGIVNGKMRYYYGKDGDGIQVDHLAEKTHLDYVLTEHGKQEYYNGHPLLDENCYKDYATLLLPRAAGYAFSLMRYFFRGQVEAVDATTTKNGNGDVTGVTMKVKNKTPKVGGSTGEIEPIGGGTDDKLVVSYEYKTSGATVYGKSSPLAFDNYSGHTYAFTGFTQPIPADATDKKYMLVYRGKLGAEEDAVAGKKFTAAEKGDVYTATILWNGSGSDIHLTKRDKITGSLKWATTQSYSSLEVYDLFVSGIAIVDDRIYFGVFLEHDINDVRYMTNHLVCLNKNTGDLIWDRIVSDGLKYTGDYRLFYHLAGDSSGIYLIGYYHTDSPYIDTGAAQKWTLDGVQDWVVDDYPDVLFQKCAVDATGLYTASISDVVKIDKTTGSLVWRRYAGINGLLYGVATQDGNVYYTITASPMDYLQKRDAATGALGWQQTHNEKSEDTAISTVHVLSMGDDVYKFNFDGTADGSLGIDIGYYTCLASGDNIVYVFDQSANTLKAYNISDGALLWEEVEITDYVYNVQPIAVDMSTP